MGEWGEGLREYLAERDEMCPWCGYNLRGLTGAVCPECGRKITIRAIKRWYQFTPAEWVFAAGSVWSVMSAAVWVAVVFTFAGDALDFLALAVPLMILILTTVLWCVWLGVLKPWGRRRPVVAVLNALGAWGIGAAGFALLIWVFVR